jgi:hypothetical protein
MSAGLLLNLLKKEYYYTFYPHEPDFLISVNKYSFASFIRLQDENMMTHAIAAVFF